MKAGFWSLLDLTLIELFILLCNHASKVETEGLLAVLEPTVSVPRLTLSSARTLALRTLLPWNISPRIHSELFPRKLFQLAAVISSFFLGPCNTCLGICQQFGCFIHAPLLLDCKKVSNGVFRGGASLGSCCILRASEVTKSVGGWAWWLIASNPRTLEVKSEWTWIQGQHGLHISILSQKRKGEGREEEEERESHVKKNREKQTQELSPQLPTPT